MSDTSDSTAAAGAKRRGNKAGAGRAAGGKGARAKAGTGARKGAAAKPAPAPVTGPAEGGTMKAKEFMTRVLARSGSNRVTAKPVVDAVLAELGEAIARGEAFVLPPLGRGRVKPAKEGATGSALTIKLNQGKGKGKNQDDTPLAPAEE